LDRVSEYVKNKPRPFDDLTDTPVFARHLQPGQRSAVFRQVTQWSKPYEDAGHAIHFFYVNVSVPGQHTLVRVELPEWVAARPVQVELLHAAIVDQCRVTGFPYPYALTRADELAVVTTVEKASLERMIAIEMMQHDVEARPSEKAATKSIARYGKHR
ncbi:MAG TPA: DNA double-strand break repair nuclease NurA, partial [Anaerolineae bacterium]